MKTLKETLDGPEIVKNNNTRKVGIGMNNLQQSQLSGTHDPNNHRGSQFSISPPRALDRIDNRDYESQTMLHNADTLRTNNNLTTKSVNSGKNIASSTLGNELKRLDVEKSVNFAMEVLAETFGEAGSPEVRKQRGFGQNNSKSPAKNV